MIGAGVLTREDVAAVKQGVLPFEEVYGLHADGVYRFCRSLLRDVEDAEDVTANTFLAAWHAYGRVNPPRDELKPWLFRIARNACIDHLRRAARRRRLLRALHLGPRTQEEVESNVLARDSVREVVDAMAELRRRDRVLVGLRVAGELTYAEIGAITGVSEEAAKTATRRALARLTTALRNNDERRRDV